MEKSAQIFISGTYEDLKEERHTVINNLNKLDNAKPVTMEYTGSNPESTLASSLKLIEKSDIFICIIAHRYGNVPGGHEKSITELEYMKASELKIPILIYITAISKEDTKYKNVEQDHTKMKKLDDFKNYLNELHTITTYSSPDDLASKVILDIKNQKLIQFVLDKSKSDFRFKEETDIIYIYRTFLAQQYRSITIFRDKSFELKDIYITLSLELNPMIWHGMGETEFIRMKKDGELPERYLEVMEMTASVHKSRVDKNLYKGSHDNELSIDDVLKASNRAVILGEAGSGKTTLFHHLIATYRDDGKKYIPVFLPIRYWLNCELCDPLDAFCKMLKEKYYKFPSNYTNALNKKLVELWKENKVLLMLDGLDEIDQNSLKHVCEILNSSKYKDNKVLISCRRTSYDQQLKGDSWWVYNINPFSEDDRLQFMVKYFKDELIANKLSGLVEYRPRLKSLGNSPLLMGLICYIFEKEKRKLPEDRVILYERCVDELLKRRENQRFEHLKDMKKDFLGYIAFHFFTRKNKKQREWFPKSEVINLLSKHIKDNDKYMDALSLTDIPAFLTELSEINSLLQPVAANSYCFPHRSFQEYFAAKYLDQLKDGFKLVTETLCEDDFWTETICLYAGMQSNATDLINALGKKGKIGLILKLIPDTVRIDWDNLDKETLNWKIRRGAVEQLVLPEVDSGKIDDITDILNGILHGAQNDPNANVRYSSLIALEKIGTPRAQEIVKSTWIIPPEIILKAAPHEYEAKGHTIKINQPGKPPNMAFVEGGPYVVEKTKEKVSVADFYMSIFPVMNWEYQRFMEDKGYARKQLWSDEGWKYCQEKKWREPRLWDDARFNHAWQPVVGVSWYEAEAYCAWYTDFLKAKPPIRLPTEAEWEYAARGLQGSEWSFGNWDENVPRWDSYHEYKEGLTFGTSRMNSVYEKSVNGYGLYDMSGNVYEWTDSWYDKNSKLSRVLRGGSWGYGYGYDLRCAFRNDYYPDSWIDAVGFRCFQGSP